MPMTEDRKYDLIVLPASRSPALDIRRHLVVKLYVIVFFFTGAELHRGTRVKIHLASDVVGNERPPFDRGLQWLNVVLQQPDDRPQLELRVPQESEQELHVAVACPAGKGAHRRVDPIGAGDDEFY